MTATATRSDQAALLATLFATGVLNGLAARVAEAWKAHGGMATMTLFGISPFELIVAFVAMRQLVRAGDRISVPGLPLLSLPYMALVLYPSSLLAWVGLVLLGTALALRGTAVVRVPALLIAGLGLCALWWIAGEPLASSTVLPLEARMVSRVLSLLRSDVIQAGNVVGSADHRIVVLTGCSSLHIVPLALLGWWALRLAGGCSRRPVDLLCVGLLATGLVALNLVRLCAMAWSARIYEVVHGDIGAIMFDGLLTAIIVTGAAVPMRPRLD